MGVGGHGVRDGFCVRDCGLVGEASGGGLEDDRRAVGCGARGDGGALAGLAAEAVAEAEEGSADQREREEDAEDGGDAEGDLMVAVGAAVFAEISVVVEETVHSAGGTAETSLGTTALRLHYPPLFMRSDSGLLLMPLGFGGRGLEGLVEEVHQLHGQREDDGGVLLDADLGEGLEVAELEGHGLGGHEGGGLD